MKSFFEVISYGISDQGLVRKKNEDAWTCMQSHLFFALADGMGGHKAGEVASSEAIRNLSMSIKRIFSSSRKENSSIQELISHLHYAIQDANYRVKELAEEHEHYSGMGTTLCCCLLHQDHLIFANVGDSRVYRYRKGLKQLSEDHSLKNHLLKKGKLTEENKERYPYKNRITKALGTHTTLNPDVSYTPIEPGDIFFLCSDGLTDYVKDSEIEQILSQNKPVNELTDQLIDAAKSKGGRDNITVVMLHLVEKATPL